MGGGGRSFLAFSPFWKRISRLSFGLLCLVSFINSGYCFTPELALEPQSLTFGSLFPGQGDTLYVTVSDTLYDPGSFLPRLSGGDPRFYPGTVRIDSEVISDPVNFKLISGPIAGDTIAVGDSSHFRVHFAPLTFGTYNATLTVYWTRTLTTLLDGTTQPVSSTDGNPFIVPQVVSLTGITGGALRLSSDNLDFGHVNLGGADTFCVTATNSSAFPTKILSADIGFGNDTSFSLISGPPPGDTIPSHESRQYCFRFAPISPGAHGATFTINTLVGPQFITLTGQGVAPVIQYGVQNLFHRVYTKLGDSLTQYIPVTSVGLGPVTFDSISITGLNPENYYVSHFPQNPLPPGMSDSIGITFTPEMEGRPDASVVISTDAVNIPVETIPLFGVGIIPRLLITPSQGSSSMLTFDSVVRGDSVCEVLALANPGSDTLLFSRQLEQGDPDFTFYPLMGTDTMILPGQSKSVNVCFRPLQRGTRLATIRFYTNIPLTYEHPRRDTSQFAINVVGTGVPAGRLALEAPIDSVAVDKQICETDTLVNVGDAALTIRSAAVGGANASEFTLSGITFPFTLSSGQQKIVTICFAPQARGLRFATLIAHGTTAGIETTTDSVLLVGFGLPKVCASATPSPASFGLSGKTLISTRDTTIITVTNCGDVATAYTATVSPANYTISGSSTSANVEPNGTASFTVVFAPTAIGAYPGILRFSGGLPDSIPLNGIGAGVTATATGSAGSVGKGACQNFTVTITNTGNMDWNAGTPTIAGANASDFTIVSGPTPNPIPAGGTATVTIRFCSSIVGAETATLSFPSSNPSPIGGFSYALTGTGVVNGVSEKTAEQGFELGQSYPNPTTGSAVVMFTLPTDAPVRIDLIDAKGSIVRTVFTGRMTSGDHTVTLDAKDLASGTYFYTLTSGDIHLSRQMILVH